VRGLKERGPEVPMVQRSREKKKEEKRRRKKKKRS